MVEELLLARADRTAVSIHGKLTALSLAIWYHHEKCISSLVSEKFVVGMEDGSGEEKRDFCRFVLARRLA
eukprot:m.154354 g.154354  ORF g.154354 m.154354 type:complete len:70 (+) comp38635_c1_seq1:258-467(+)